MDVVFPVNREKTKQGGDKQLQVGQVVLDIISMKQLIGQVSTKCLVSYHFNVSCGCV